MQVAIVYDSRTGTTRGAAEAMAASLSEQGHTCTVRHVADTTPEEAATADLVCVGSWTQGLFIAFQHATKRTMEFLARLPRLDGKRAVVFCTYRMATGKMLPKMAAALRDKGAEVVGEFRFKGPNPDESFSSFAASTAAGA